jgi:hypothetical protein
MSGWRAWTSKTSDRQTGDGDMSKGRTLEMYPVVVSNEITVEQDNSN